MPEAFIISPGDMHERERYALGGFSALNLMHVRCPDCGDTAVNGLHYVGVSSSAIDRESAALFRAYRPEARGGEQFTGPTTITVEQLDHLRERLAPLLGPERPVSPGMDIGPALGRAAGRFGDFAWPHFSARVCLRRSVHNAMDEAGFRLSVVMAGFVYRRERKDPLVEIDIPLSAHLVGWRKMEVCEVCGLTKRPAGLEVVDAGSWDDSIPMQRIYERANTILVNRALANFIRDRQMTDVTLTPAKLG